MLRLAWIVISVFLSALCAWQVWQHPKSIWAIVDISASVLAIFVGVSVALFTVLASRPALSGVTLVDEEERERIRCLVDEDDGYLIGQQYFLFVIYLITIGLALLIKFLSNGVTKPEEIDLFLKVASSAFGLFVCLSFMLSVFLPSVATRLVKQRRALG